MPRLGRNADAGSMFPRPMCSWMLRPLYYLSNHPWPMCPVPGPHEGTGHNPVVSDASLHPCHPPLLCPHIITLIYRFAQLGDTPMSLRSKYFSGWFGQGHNNQGTLTFVLGAQHPRIFGRGHIGRGWINIAPWVRECQWPTFFGTKRLGTCSVPG